MFRVLRTPYGDTPLHENGKWSDQNIQSKDTNNILGVSQTINSHLTILFPVGSYFVLRTPYSVLRQMRDAGPGD